MPRGRPKHPDILTPREWQVLDLIREGLTNEQIARRLGISENGVKYHVLEILSKLGVSSRYEAAAWRREPAAASRSFAGLGVLFALRPKLGALTASKVLAGVLIISAFGFMAALAIGVLVMNNRGAGNSVAPDPTMKALAVEATASAAAGPVETPTPDETETAATLEAAKGTLTPIQHATSTPDHPLSSTELFMLSLPPSVPAALADFAASEGSSYAGPCSPTTQPGQLCMTNVDAIASDKAMQVELSVWGGSGGYGLTLVPNGDGGYQIESVDGPPPVSPTPR
jgi:DNA-binding CsgD family transcriptional regulator